MWSDSSMHSDWSNQQSLMAQVNFSMLVRVSLTHFNLYYTLSFLNKKDQIKTFLVLNCWIQVYLKCSGSRECRFLIFTSPTFQEMPPSHPNTFQANRRVDSSYILPLHLNLVHPQTPKDFNIIPSAPLILIEQPLILWFRTSLFDI